ncbi:hypothetical protein AB0M22_05355 [Nocardia sp. NPDC051756]|uniref:hypothetical protein n=1 Tax=Nocardia sp. NPDC051756 TaxID=3154751 RepID=UPI003439AEF8
MTTNDRNIDTRRLPLLVRKPTQRLVLELMDAAAGTRTGILRVAGDPGGDFRVEGGQIVAVHSAGAPGVFELLARPGRGPTGDAELRAVTAMAAVDGAFAIAAGWLDSCFWAETSTAAPAGVAGIEPGWLLAETEWRLRALAQTRVSPHRNRLLLSELGKTRAATAATSPRHEILRQVDGQRTCRDIAFLLYRSLYAVTVEVSRLLAEDLLLVPPPDHDRRADRMPPPDSADPRPLPRRRRGASGINDVLRPRPPQPVLSRSPLDPTRAGPALAPDSP